MKKYGWLQIGAAGVGVMLTLSGCGPSDSSPDSNSNVRPGATATARPDKNAPVDQRVRAIVIEQLGSKKQPKLTDRFVEDLGADSLDCVELVMALEEEFSFEIPDQDAIKLKTMGDAVAYITARIAQR